MSNHKIIADAHALANEQMERIRILALLLPRSSGILPSSQMDDIHAWILEMADRAQDAIQSASDALANLQEEAK